MVAFATEVPTWPGRVELGRTGAICGAATLFGAAAVGLAARDDGVHSSGAVVVSGALPASIVGASIVVPAGRVGARVGDLRIVARGDIVIVGGLVQRAARALGRGGGGDLGVAGGGRAASGGGRGRGGGRVVRRG